MHKKFWQLNLILLISLGLIIGGYYVVKKIWFGSLLKKIEQQEAAQIYYMPAAVKKLVDNNFKIPLLATEQFKNLIHSISLPLDIKQKGNPEPYNPQNQ